MTVISSVPIDGTPLGQDDIWYTPILADSSFVDDVKVRLNSDGTADVKYILDGGREYEYHTDQEFARAVWTDLHEDQQSPGMIFSVVRDYVKANPVAKTAPKPTQWTIRVSGDADRIDLLARHLIASGFDVL